MFDDFCNERRGTKNKKHLQTDTNRKKFKKKVEKYDHKICKPINTLINQETKHTSKEQNPCTACYQSLEKKVTNGNNGLFNLDKEEEQWYLGALLSGPSALSNFKNIFPEKFIKKATGAQCKESGFNENYFKDIQFNSSQKSDEGIPCNSPKKPKSIELSKANHCKCPPSTIKNDNTKNTVKKCIGHSLIGDDKTQRSIFRQKKSKIPVVSDKKTICKSKPKWISEVPTNYEIDPKKAGEGCQGADERVICCTQFNEVELDTHTFKAEDTKKPKRKKKIPKKTARDCKCDENEKENRKNDARKTRKNC